MLQNSPIVLNMDGELSSFRRFTNRHGVPLYKESREEYDNTGQMGFDLLPYCDYHGFPVEVGDPVEVYPPYTGEKATIIAFEAPSYDPKGWQIRPKVIVQLKDGTYQHLTGKNGFSSYLDAYVYSFPILLDKEITKNEQF